MDIFHCSTRRFWEPEFAGSDLNLAGWTKKLTGKPVITVGSVGLNASFIDEEKRDMVDGSGVATASLMLGARWPVSLIWPAARCRTGMGTVKAKNSGLDEVKTLV